VDAQQKKDWLVINCIMNRQNRDLIILRKDALPNQQTIDQEVASLNLLLQEVESSSHFCDSFELIDLNKFKVIKKTHILSMAVKSNKKKPFEFLINCN
jgi:hypothetical protein